MFDSQIGRVEHSVVNARILAREVRADFKDVEAASLKMVSHFTSPEGKRVFVRFFNSFQLIVYFISVICRTKLTPESVAQVEDHIRRNLEQLNSRLNTNIDGAEVLFKNNGITVFASYDTEPLKLQVSIISSIGRRFYEILNKFDQLMPLLQTLEIHDVITLHDADTQRLALKREIRGFVRSTRGLASGLRQRMKEQSSMDTPYEQYDDQGGKQQASVWADQNVDDGAKLEATTGFPDRQVGEVDRTDLKPHEASVQLEPTIIDD